MESSCRCPPLIPLLCRTVAPHHAILGAEAVDGLQQLAELGFRHARRMSAHHHEAAIHPRHDAVLLERGGGQVFPLLGRERQAVPLHLVAQVAKQQPEQAVLIQAALPLRPPQRQPHRPASKPPAGHIPGPLHRRHQVVRLLDDALHFLAHATSSKLISHDSEHPLLTSRLSDSWSSYSCASSLAGVKPPPLAISRSVSVSMPWRKKTRGVPSTLWPDKPCSRSMRSGKSYHSGCSF